MSKGAAAARHQAAPETGERDHQLATPYGVIVAREWGTASSLVPLVLLHDSLGCIDLWRGLPSKLTQATGRRVIAYDRPGFGQSAPQDRRLQPDFVVSEAEHAFRAVLDGLGIDRFVAAGHSVGGGMTLAIAAAYPKRCLAGISISAQSFLEDLTRVGIREAETQFADPAMRQKLARYHGARTDWVLDAWIGSWLSPAFDGWSLDAVLAKIRQPLLSIHGALDEYGSPEQLKRIAGISAGPVRSLLIEDAAHFPHRSHEAETLVAITAFLDGVE